MQESKYITINTKSLFEELKLCKKNLEITEKGLRLQRRLLMLHIENLSNPHDFLTKHTFYINQETKSSLESHKDSKEPSFPPLPDDPAKVIENLEGRAIYEENKELYVIGTFEAPLAERKEHLVAFEENDFKILKDTGKKLVLLIGENGPFESSDPKKTDEIRKGIYYSKAVDSGIEKNQWYRFILEGSFPRGTNIEFDYYISDDPDYEKALKTHKSKCEQGQLDGWEKGLPGSSAIQGEEKRDALFRTEKKGRYLWFRITLVGTDKLSPVISSGMLFFPKISYLEYLPSVYREDFANSDFLDRFLAIFESLFFEIDFTIDHLSRWLDAAGSPPEFLEWLGSWTGADQGRAEGLYRKEVPEAKQREYISQAVSMYRNRGTKKGLENLIFFYTGKKPIIIDIIPFCTKGNKENGEEHRSFRKNNFSFFVLFKEGLEEDERELIRNIIEEEKPAHTTYKLIEHCFDLNKDVYLGVNTKLS